MGSVKSLVEIVKGLSSYSEQKSRNKWNVLVSAAKAFIICNTLMEEEPDNWWLCRDCMETVISGSSSKKNYSFSQLPFEMSLNQIWEQWEEEEAAKGENLPDVVEELTCRFCANGAE